MKYFLTLLLSLGIMFCSAAPMYAATLFFETQKATGALLPVDVLLDTEGEEINSAEVLIKFPVGLIFSGHDSTKSALSMWLKEPNLDANGNIFFAGIVPGGIERVYDPEEPSKRALTLARLYFRAPSKVTGTFTIIESRVLKNDGKGSRVIVETLPTTFSTEAITDSGSTDTTLPEPFQISIQERSALTRTPSLALFATTDAGGGIKSYEAKIGSSGYRLATSPHPLPQRLLAYTFWVRATDFEGNSRESSVLIPGNKSLRDLSIIGLLFVAYVLYTYGMRKRIRQ